MSHLCDCLPIPVRDVTRGSRTPHVHTRRGIEPAPGGTCRPCGGGTARGGVGAERCGHSFRDGQKAKTENSATSRKAAERDEPRQTRVKQDLYRPAALRPRFGSNSLPVMTVRCFSKQWKPDRDLDSLGTMLRRFSFNRMELSLLSHQF